MMLRVIRASPRHPSGLSVNEGRREEQVRREGGEAQGGHEGEGGERY